MNPDLLKVRRNRWLSSIGRLKPGVTIQQAQKSANQLARSFGEESPQNAGWGIRVQPLTEARVGGLRSAQRFLGQAGEDQRLQLGGDRTLGAAGRQVG